MDASILLVGDDEFLAALSELTRDLEDCTIEAVSTPTEAIPLIQAQQPDLLLMQANQIGSLSLCSQIKAQSRLSWIYCILLEGFSLSASSPKPLKEAEHFEFEIMVLDAGADAYLWGSSAPPEPCPELTDLVIGGDRPSQASVSSVSNSGISDSQGRSILHRRLAAQIKVGLRRVQNHRELMRTNDLLSTIALSDPLTELNNRRAFEWELPRQIKNARSRETPISLLVIDVDFFKTINDNHGHLVGDRALHLIASRLRHNLRFCDTPFRYGGEEFVIILNDTDCHEALLVAQRLCRLIGDQPFAVSDMLDLQITISAGTATLNSDDDERGVDLFNRADQNLLKAKNQGRNRVVACIDPAAPCCRDCLAMQERDVARSSNS